VIVVCILVLVLGLQIKVRNFNQKFKELLRHPHNHLICSICGNIVNTDLDVDKSLISTEKLQQGFDIKGIYIDFYGVCPKCKKNR
jgi:Fur family transcriptional regulator, peroxide stress response regulator